MPCIDFVYDIIRADERLLLDALRSLRVSVRLLNAERAVMPEGLGNVGLIRLMSRSRVIPTAYTYEIAGGIAINPASSLVISHDKYLTYLYLKKGGVPVPKTYLAFGPDAVRAAAEMLSYPVIVKPTGGSWGRLVSLVKSREELETLVLHREAMESNMRIYLIQEYVSKPNRDIRVMVVGERAVAAIYRINDSDWRTNMARGGRAEPVKIDPELEEVAVRANRVVGAYYSGVDVVESERGYVVLEVNGTPEFKNVQRTTGVDVAGEIARLVVELIKK